MRCDAMTLLAVRCFMSVDFAALRVFWLKGLLAKLVVILLLKK